MGDKNRYARRILLLGTICLAALTLTAVVPSPVSTVASAAALAAAAADPFCEVLCDDTTTPYCDPEEHLVWNADEPGVTWLNAMRRGGSHPTSCYNGDCESMHDAGQCQAYIIPGESPLTPEITEHLRQAIVAADAMEVRALLKAHPSQLSFNIKRSAIQVRACNGRLKEHLALSHKIVGELVVTAN
jgi:hypothetical protein